MSELERYCKEGGHFSFWAGLPIFSIDYAHLEDWSAWLADRRLGPKTRWNVMAAFHAFIGWLYKREDLRELPREYPWPRVPEHAPAVLTREAQARLLDAIPYAKRGIFLVLGLMGLRPGVRTAAQRRARRLAHDRSRAKGQDARRTHPRHQDWPCEASADP